MVDRGFEVHGVELNELAFEGIDRRVQQHVSASLSELRFASGYFDEVIIWHVLEHLPDPRGTIREIRRVLKAGGTLVVAVPNFSSWQSRWTASAWFHLDLPRHLFHFPLAALQRLISEEGFVCTATHHFSLRQNPFGWLQSVLNRWTRLPRNGLYVQLQKRPSSHAPPVDPWTRFQLWLAFWVGMPLAIGMSIVETLFRGGGTVHVVARKNSVTGRAEDN
jgi:2-polyprenyl-3-methyl-5-hydroxy-6-metoxy-1,4-benzoquinol methylase